MTKGSYGLPGCGSSNAHGQSPIGASIMFVFTLRFLKVPTICLLTEKAQFH